MPRGPQKHHSPGKPHHSALPGLALQLNLHTKDRWLKGSLLLGLASYHYVKTPHKLIIALVARRQHRKRDGSRMKQGAHTLDRPTKGWWGGVT